jgi:hypothetical protein
MASNCGCATGRGIVMDGVDPVLVTGLGVPGSPFIVSLRHGDKTGCSALVACLADIMGDGLTYNAASDSIRVVLSGDDRNTLKFGSDGGLKVYKYLPKAGACQEQERLIPSTCPTDLLVGAHKMAALAGPFSAGYQVDYCLANEIDILHCHTFASVDGVACVTDHWDGAFPPSRYLVNRSASVGTVTADQYKRTVAVAGAWTDPEMRLDATSDTSDRDGGWWGWRVSDFNALTLADVLQRARGKMMVLADCQHSNAEQEAKNVQAVLRTSAQLCWQDIMFVGVRNISNARTVLESGGEPIMIHDTEIAHSTTTAQWSAADVAAAGVRWAALTKQYADGVFNEYTSAGIKVLMLKADRHHERQRCTTLGLCGYLSSDPVYTRGPVPYDYRMDKDPTRLGNVGPGMLSWQTSRGSFAGLVNKDARGYSKNGELGGGLWTFSGWGDGRGRPTVLVGWACPLPHPTAYTIEFQVRYDSATDGQAAKIGFLLGVANDVDPYNWPSGSLYPSVRPFAYNIYLRQSGWLGISLLHEDGSTSYLNGDTAAASATGQEVRWDTGATTGTPPRLPVGQWQRCRLEVGPNTLVLQKTTMTGDVSAVDLRANTGPAITDPKRKGPRGPYFYYMMEELERPFTGAIRITDIHYR